jgi:hypothetical protein
MLRHPGVDVEAQFDHPRRDHQAGGVERVRGRPIQPVRSFAASDALRPQLPDLVLRP